MSEPKVIPVVPRGLVVNGRESRRIVMTVEFEASVALVLNEKAIDRIRNETGQWIAVRTVRRRLEALGGKIVRGEMGESGEHTPNY